MATRAPTPTRRNPTCFGDPRGIVAAGKHHATVAVRWTSTPPTAGHVSNPMIARWRVNDLKPTFTGPS
eukprot:11228042-Lingulodinium_polyedra.AAC.1